MHVSTLNLLRAHRTLRSEKRKTSAMQMSKGISFFFFLFWVTLSVGTMNCKENESVLPFSLVFTLTFSKQTMFEIGFGWYCWFSVSIEMRSKCVGDGSVWFLYSWPANLIVNSGLWGGQCKSSMIAKENCALRCLSPACYELVYEGDPVRERIVERYLISVRFPLIYCLCNLSYA